MVPTPRSSAATSLWVTPGTTDTAIHRPGQPAAARVAAAAGARAPAVSGDAGAPAGPAPRVPVGSAASPGATRAGAVGGTSEGVDRQAVRARSGSHAITRARPADSAARGALAA